MKSQLKHWLPAPVIGWLKHSPLATRVWDTAGPVVGHWRYRNVPFDQVYGDDYFAMIERTSLESAAAMADSLMAHFSPQSVIDIGCGTGVLLSAFEARGVASSGIDKAGSALRRCRERQLKVSPLDLSLPESRAQISGTFDLATSFEVGHQLPSDQAAGYVDLLCRLSNLVVFSSDPGGDDRLPMNPKPPSYWIRCFFNEGFAFDEPVSATLKREWENNGTAHWFSRFPMVFRRMT